MKKNELSNVFYLHITEKHSGKMQGMASLSTNPLENKQCSINRTIEGSICKEGCFSCKQMKRYTALKNCLSLNLKTLTSEVLPLEELPKINKMYFRFEAFGDLENEIQFINYLNICKKNPRTNFAIWTKNPKIIKRVFEAGHEKPNNLIIVYSSLFLNKVVKLETLHEKMSMWFIDKVFTVFTKEYLKAHPEIIVNCGSNNCIDCLACYDPSFNNVIYINEEIK